MNIKNSIGLIFLVGCSTVNAPIDSKISTGTINLSLPKDSSGAYLEYKHKVVNPTNGEINNISLILSNFVFKNNPLVMDAKTRHDVGIINATGNAVNDIVESAVAGAVKGAK